MSEIEKARGWRSMLASRDVWSLVIAALALVVSALSLNATLAALDVQRTSAERQARAYLYLEQGELKIEGDRLTFGFRVKNGGHTPSFDVTWTQNLGWFLQGQSAPPMANPVQKAARAYIGPGGTLDASEAIGFPGISAEVVAGKIVPFVRGHVEYRDAFNNARYLDYLLYGRRRPDGSWMLTNFGDGSHGN